MDEIKRMNGPSAAIAAVVAAGGVVHLVLFAISGEVVYLGIALAYLLLASVGAVVAVRANR